VRASVLLAALLLGAAPSARAQTSPAGVIYAITGASVVPMDRELVLPGHTVIVRDGRIAALGPDGAVAVPAGAVRIDARGRFLLPGLADMHVHLFDRDELLLYVASGVTTVRNLHGIPRHLAWRDSIARGELLGPRLFTSGPIVDGDPPTRSTSVVVRTAAEAERVVREQKREGYDFLKIYDAVPPDLYRVLAAAARRAGLPMIGHLPTPVGLEGLLATRGQVGLEHVEELLPLHADGRDTAGVDATARALASAGVWVTPTVTVHASARAQALDWPALAARPAMRYVNPATARTWGWEPSARGNAGNPAARERYERTVGFFERSLIPALHRAGVRLLAGTDAPIATIVPGFSLVDELASFRRAGLSPYEVLVTATRGPAEFLGRSGELGVVAVGARADLVLLDASPLADLETLARPRGVMAGGRWLSREWLDAELERLAARYAASGEDAAPAVRPASAASADRSHAAAELLAVDRAFAAAAARTDLVSALTAMFDPQVAMVAPGRFARGVRVADSALRANPANAGAVAAWTPIRGGVSADGRHGFTYGYFTSTLADGSRIPGKYVAYWRRGDAGWRVAVYKRARRSEGEVSSAERPPFVPRAGAPSDAGSAARWAAELEEVERRFSADAQSGFGAAFRRWAAADGAHVGPPDDPSFRFGPDEIARGMDDGESEGSVTTWRAHEVLAAGSGDLGATLGVITTVAPAREGTPARTVEVPYFTVWGRAAPGEPWRFLVD
jgi:imidazolonepropionase-like amidohydrolase/ketosteroid isomerase-like protein